MTKHLGTITALLLCTHIVVCNQDAIKLRLRIGATSFEELTPNSQVSLVPANKNDPVTQKFLANTEQIITSFKTVKTDPKTVIFSAIAIPGILKLLADPFNLSQSIGAYTIATLSIAGFCIFQNWTATDDQHWFKSTGNTTMHLKKQDNRWVVEYLKIA